MAKTDRVVIASRGSKLALHQTGLVRDRLEELNPGVEFEIKVVKTEADQKADAPLSAISGEGIFVKELEIQGVGFKGVLQTSRGIQELFIRIPARKAEVAKAIHKRFPG